MMFSKEQFTTVTPLSKALAMVVFIVLPFVAFFVGMNFGKQMIRPIELIVIPRTENVEEADTSDWQTYRNEELGFELKFPTGFLVDNEEKIDYPGDRDGYYFKLQGPQDYFVITVNSDNPTTPRDVPSLDGEDYYYSIKETESGNLEVYGEELIVFDDSHNGVADEKIVITSGLRASNDNLYSFYFVQDKEGQNLEIFNRILSTFRFIEPIDTSSWQTYRNEEYGFSFQYPAAWGSVEEDSIEDYWYSPDFTNNPDCGFGVVTASYWPTVLAADPNFGRGGSLYDMQGFSTSSTGSIDSIFYSIEGELTKRPAGGYSLVEGQSTTGIINENLNYFDTPTIHAVFNTNHEEVTAINIFCYLDQESLSIMKRLVSTFSLN